MFPLFIIECVDGVSTIVVHFKPFRPDRPSRQNPTILLRSMEYKMNSDKSSAESCRPISTQSVVRKRFEDLIGML